MENLILFICFTCSIGGLAQSKSSKEIAGVYIENSNDPVGGSTIVLLPDQNFTISYFGGIQTGKWELKNGKVFFKNKYTTRIHFVWPKCRRFGRYFQD